MNQLHRLIIAACLLMPCSAVLGQTGRMPKLAIEPIDSVPPALSRVTNFNPSVSLADTALAVVADSLRTDGIATIITVYETDADSVVGLWQIGGDGNRALWLNSQRASYDEFSVAYRASNEHGVIIHTMQYQYPAIDSTYDGHDTLYLGREGATLGDKNMCAFLYYSGRLDYRYKRQLESALAIRYGAVLHGPYLNSLYDTLWNPLGIDSLYSSGICGIGRDDSLSLHQPRSMIRNGILTIEAATALVDREHVFLGCDTGGLDLGGEVVLDDSTTYLTVARRWKLRAHTYGGTIAVRLAIGLPLPATALRLLIATADGTALVAPDTAGTFALDLADGQDYYLALLVNPYALTPLTQSVGGWASHDVEPASPSNNNAFSHSSNPALSVSPNPTSGRYTLRVDQPEDDIIDIRIVDANGRIVEQYTTPEPLSRYTHKGHLAAAGTYYVTVGSNGRQQTIKLIVVR